MPKGERSEGMMRVLNALVGAGVSDPVIYEVFEAQGIGEKYREKGTNRRTWLQPQIEKAKAYTSSDNYFQALPSSKTSVTALSENSRKIDGSLDSKGAVKSLKK